METETLRCSQATRLASNITTLHFEEVTPRSCHLSHSVAAIPQSNIIAIPNTFSPLQTFPFLDLPPELRHEIYAQYFAALPPLHINCSNHMEQCHLQTPLTSTSRLIRQDIQPWLFYQNTTFSFSCPKSLATFSKEDIVRRNVKTVRITPEEGITNVSMVQSPDWVFLVLENFQIVEELIFVVEKGNDAGGAWWECVLDAVREGTCLKRMRIIARVEYENKELVEDMGAEKSTKT